MNYLEIEFGLVTPAFVSTADQNLAELGAQTIKGVLRWWWRALPEHADLKHDLLRKREGLIFGAAHQELRLRSKVVLSVQPKHLGFRDQGKVPYSCSHSVRAGKFEIDALHYLSYGPVATVGKREKDPNGRAYNPKFNDTNGKAKSGLILKRPALEPDSTFLLRLSWREGSLTVDQERELVRALAAWLELGGIGSRSRKGWGSVAFKKEPHIPDRLREVFEAACKEFRNFNGQPTAKISPTAWPSLARFFVLERITGSPWEEVLGELGQLYKRLRPSARSSESWIAGSAKPRRASSIILKVRPKGGAEQELEGILGVFVCYKDAGANGQADWNRFFTSLTWR